MEAEKSIQKKRIVGFVAIALLLLFTVLALFNIISWVVWVLADLVVAGVANLLFRRISRKPL